MTNKRRKLSEISHTNPYTNRAFGDTQAYDRGQTVAADGGEAESVEEDAEETLADVSHASPNDETGAQRTFDRGVNR